MRVETENDTTRIPATCPPRPEALARVINQTPWTNPRVRTTAASGTQHRFAPPSARDLRETMRNESTAPKHRVLVPVQAYQTSFVVKVCVSSRALSAPSFPSPEGRTARSSSLIRVLIVLGCCIALTCWEHMPPNRRCMMLGHMPSVFVCNDDTPAKSRLPTWALSAWRRRACPQSARPPSPSSPLVSWRRRRCEPLARGL